MHFAPSTRLWAAAAGAVPAAAGTGAGAAGTAAKVALAKGLAAEPQPVAKDLAVARDLAAEPHPPAVKLIRYSWDQWHLPPGEERGPARWRELQSEKETEAAGWQCHVCGTARPAPGRFLLPKT